MITGSSADDIYWGATHSTGWRTTSGDDYMVVYDAVGSRSRKDTDFGWTTNLWDRDNKSHASAKLNYLQGVARRAKPASRKRAELEMLRLGEIIRGCE